MSFRTIVLSAAVLLAAGCGDDEQGEGTLTVTAYGESFIEDGIPASETNDGWAVNFERFDVSLADVMVAGVAVPVNETIDLATASSGEGHPVGAVSLPAGEYTHGSYTISRLAITGTATKGTEIKTFHWVFGEPTRYTECETTTKVKAGGEAEFQITVHADHLLYDSAVAENPELRFQALADADADGDGDITRPELGFADIGAYDPGSESGVDNLWLYLSVLARTLGHVDGEGHCHASHED